MEKSDFEKKKRKSDQINYNHNKYQRQNNKNIKKIIESDFVEKYNQNGDFVNEKGEKLLSCSTFLETFTKLKLAKIPATILDTATLEGKDLMNQLECLVNEKKELDQIPSLSNKTQNMFYAFLNHCIDQEYLLKCCEKHVSNEYFHGYLDLIVKDSKINTLFICEIKTRSNWEVRLSDLIQCFFYMNIAHVRNCKLFILNKKEMKVQEHLIKINDKRIWDFLRSANKLFKLMGLEQYQFMLWYTQK